MRFVTFCEIGEELNMVDLDKYPHVEVGRRLEAIRNSTGLNIKDYVALMDIPYTRYINWETGARRLKPEDAERFCDRFSLSMDFIYRGKLDALPENVLKALSSMPRDRAHKRSKDSPEASAS